MQTAVNPAGFRNAVVVFRACVIVARREFLHRNLIGRVAVYLICAEKNADRVRTLLPVTRTFIEQQAYQKKRTKPESWLIYRPSSGKLPLRRVAYAASVSVSILRMLSARSVGNATKFAS